MAKKREKEPEKTGMPKTLHLKEKEKEFIKKLKEEHPVLKYMDETEIAHFLINRGLEATFNDMNPAIKMPDKNDVVLKRPEGLNLPEMKRVF